MITEEEADRRSFWKYLQFGLVGFAAAALLLGVGLPWLRGAEPDEVQSVAPLELPEVAEAATAAAPEPTADASQVAEAGTAEPEPEPPPVEASTTAPAKAEMEARKGRPAPVIAPPPAPEAEPERAFVSFVFDKREVQVTAPDGSLLEPRNGIALEAGRPATFKVFVKDDGATFDCTIPGLSRGQYTKWSLDTKKQVCQQR